MNYLFNDGIMGILLILGIVGAIGLYSLFHYIDKRPNESKDNEGCISVLGFIFLALLVIGFVSFNLKECSSNHSSTEPTHMFRP